MPTVPLINYLIWLLICNEDRHIFQLWGRHHGQLTAWMGVFRGETERIQDGTVSYPRILWQYRFSDHGNLHKPWHGGISLRYHIGLHSSWLDSQISWLYRFVIEKTDSITFVPIHVKGEEKWQN